MDLVSTLITHSRGCGSLVSTHLFWCMPYYLISKSPSFEKCARCQQIVCTIVTRLVLWVVACHYRHCRSDLNPGMIHHSSRNDEWYITSDICIAVYLKSLLEYHCVGWCIDCYALTSGCLLMSGISSVVLCGALPLTGCCVLLIAMDGDLLEVVQSLLLNCSTGNACWNLLC